MRELYKLIGKQGRLSVQGWQVPVVIDDVRQAFGRVDVLVRDATESNRQRQQWVSVDRVSVDENS